MTRQHFLIVICICGACAAAKASEEPLQCLAEAARGSKVQASNSSTTADLLAFDFSSLGGDNQVVPSLAFSVTLSEQFSQASSIRLLYWAVGHDQTWITVPRTPDQAVEAQNNFSIKRELNRYARDGLYAVRSLRMTDDLGSAINLNEGELNDLGFDTQVSVRNDLADVIAPQLERLEFGIPVYESTQPIVDFELEASDDVSGVQSGVVMEFLSPTGKSLQKRVYLEEETNTATGVFSFPLNAANGEYRVNTIRLYDNAGNSSFSEQFLTQNPSTAVVSIEHDAADNQLPTLDSLQLTAVFDPCANRPFVKVAGFATDDLSGVDGVYLRMGRPEGGLLDRWISYRSAELIHEFSHDIALTTEFTAGTYSVGYLRLDDFAGNQLSYSGPALGGPIDSEVRVWFPELDGLRVANDIRQDRIAATITGSDGSDYMFGSNDSDDELLAGDGDDFLFPSEGDDSMYGGAGDDIFYLQQMLLSAQEVRTGVYGESGSDTFLFGSATALGAVTIYGLDSSDKLDLSERLAFDSVASATQSPADAGLIRIIGNSFGPSLQALIDESWATLASFPEQTSDALVRDTIHSDKDGIPDSQDDFPTDPAAALDSDGDGYPDRWNNGYTASGSVWGLRIDMFPNDPFDWADADADGLGDNRELSIGTDPSNPDTDSDSWTDGEEVDWGSDPLDPSSEPPMGGLPVWLLYEVAQ